MRLLVDAAGSTRLLRENFMIREIKWRILQKHKNHDVINIFLIVVEIVFSSGENRTN